MTTTTRETTWRALVLQAEPDHVRMNRMVTEYQFSSATRGRDSRTHEDGYRVFRGDYMRRGPYQPEIVLPHGLTFGGVPITFGSEPMTYGDE
jgi:hypothetical protein